MVQRSTRDHGLERLSRCSRKSEAAPQPCRPVDGVWLNPATGALIREQPIVIYVYVVPEQFLAHSAALVAFIKRLGRETNQGAVAIEFDGQFYFIENFEE